MSDTPVGAGTAWRELIELAAAGATSLLLRKERLVDIESRALLEVRADERRRVLMEMAALARELETVGKRVAAGVVKDMWTRINRRMGNES